MLGELAEQLKCLESWDLMLAEVWWEHEVVVHPCNSLPGGEAVLVNLQSTTSLPGRHAQAEGVHDLVPLSCQRIRRRHEYRPTIKGQEQHTILVALKGSPSDPDRLPVEDEDDDFLSNGFMMLLLVSSMEYLWMIVGVGSEGETEECGLLWWSKHTGSRPSLLFIQILRFNDVAWWLRLTLTLLQRITCWLRRRLSVILCICSSSCLLFACVSVCLFRGPFYSSYTLSLSFLSLSAKCFIIPEWFQQQQERHQLHHHWRQQEDPLQQLLLLVDLLVRPQSRHRPR